VHILHRQHDTQGQHGRLYRDCHRSDTPYLMQRREFKFTTNETPSRLHLSSRDLECVWSPDRPRHNTVNPCAGDGLVAVCPVFPSPRKSRHEILLFSPLLPSGRSHQGHHGVCKRRQNEGRSFIWKPVFSSEYFGVNWTCADRVAGFISGIRKGMSVCVAQKLCRKWVQVG
jgi:hypothetical protein